MSWRAGAELFWEMWPKVKVAIPDPEDRAEFARPLLELFLDNDVDPCSMQGGDPEIDRLMEELDAEAGRTTGRMNHSKWRITAEEAKIAEN